MKNSFFGEWAQDLNQMCQKGLKDFEEAKIVSPDEYRLYRVLKLITDAFLERHAPFQNGTKNDQSS
jgi:hypothetical protein